MNQALTVTPIENDWQKMLDTVKDTVAKDSTAAEFKVFVYQAQKTGLDPLARQIYAVKRDGKQVIQSSIDGMRLVAQRTGKYRGQTPKQWCGKDGKWVDVWLSSELPAAAKVGVWHEDFKEPMVAVAKWDSYVVLDKEKKPSFMWKKMPDLMLAKCAEMLALRMAFPQELSGIYGTEEMEQADQHAKTISRPAAETTQATQAQAGTPAVEVKAEVVAPSGNVEDVAKFREWIESLETIAEICAAFDKALGSATDAPMAASLWKEFQAVALKKPGSAKVLKENFTKYTAKRDSFSKGAKS